MKKYTESYSGLTQFQVWVYGWLKLFIALVKILSLGWINLDQWEIDYIFYWALKNAENKINKRNK